MRKAGEVWLTCGVDAKRRSKKLPTSRHRCPSNRIMHGDRSALAVASAAIVLSVAGVPGLAQSNAVRWRTTALSELALDVASNAVGVYAEPYAASDGVDAPPNLTVPSTYRKTLELMLERSPMFRRQCLRLASATQLTVVVRMLHPSDGGPRARTEIKREDDRLVATVQINPLGNFMELLAHELEHVIEQLDGIDLAAKASLARTGVRSCADGTFETSRAVWVDSVVAVHARGR